MGAYIITMSLSNRCLTCLKGVCGSVATLQVTESKEEEELKGLTYRKVLDLGQGATGRVSLVIEESSGDHLTCKAVSLTRKHKAEREVAVLRKLTGPHLPRFRDISRTAESILILTEYIPGRDLYVWYEGTSKRQRRQLMSGYLKMMIVCLQELAADGFVHLDIKPENFILSDDGKLKLIDLGCAHPIHSRPKQRLRSSAGTAGYSPPEIYTGYYHKNTDIWSLAVCVWTLYFGERPFPDVGRKGEKITSTTFVFPTEYHNARLERLPKALGDFMRSCLIFRPSRRMNIDQILTHECVQ